MEYERLVEVLGIVFVCLLFAVVIFKYFDNSWEYVSEKVFGNKKVVVNGYVVGSVIDEEKVLTDYSNFVSVNRVVDSGNEGNKANSVPVLVYHGLTPLKGNDEDLLVSEFEEQMFVLKQAGYETITLDELYLFMRGEIELPEKSFMITFDDGRRDSYYYADDVLKVLNYSAVMFVVVKYSFENSNSYYLDYEELLEMNNSGRWELQSHSYDGHRMVVVNSLGEKDSFFGNKMWIESEDRLETDEEYEERIKIDLLESRYLLEEVFDTNVNSFAIPFSDFGQYESNYNDAEEVSKEVYSEIYKMVFYQYKPIKNKDFRANYNDKLKDFYFIMRITVEPHTSWEELIKMVDATCEIELPYNESFYNEKRWLKNWGEFEIINNSLILKNSEDFRTTLVYLDGSYLFEDYVFSSDVKKSSNQTFQMIVRFQNVDNSVSCILGDDYVMIEEVIDSERIVLVKEKFPGVDSNEVFVNMKVVVEDNDISCYIDGENVVSADLDFIVDYGGVGFKSSLVEEMVYGETVIRNISVVESGRE